MADIRGHAEGLKALDKPLKYKMTMITQWDRFNTFITNMALQDRHPCEIAELFFGGLTYAWLPGVHINQLLQNLAVFFLGSGMA